MSKLMKHDAFEWWREQKLCIKKSFINKYYSGSDFFVIDSNIDRIEEIYIEEKVNRNRDNENNNIG